MPAVWKPELRKVCGITCPEDARHAVQAGANAVGMVFYPPSPRAVSPTRAAQVAAAVPDTVRRVGVFVDEAPASIAATVRQARLSVVQLHGRETPERCGAVRRELGPDVAIWKAVRIGPRFDAAELEAFSVDALLLDTDRAGLYGGTGETFPWEAALAAKRYGPVVLSGGLHGGNAAEAVRTVRPWGVDASSRLEREPGLKDPAKVTRFLSAVR